MTQAPGLSWNWQPRAEPVVARAAVAWGNVARRLHARLQQLPAPQAARLQATANAQVLLVLGEEADLPWIEGLQYAAPDPEAPQLWLPTHYQPDVSPALLAQALLARCSSTPLLLWHQPKALIPLHRQLPVSAQHLARIAAYWAEP